MAGKPTEAQVKEFWEWCGFKLKEDWRRRGFHYEATVKCPNWIYPDNPHWEYGESYLPRLDLNNLFKYAVPKLENDVAIKIFKGDYSWIVELWKDNIIARDHDKDPATALFLAIEKVI